MLPTSVKHPMIYEINTRVWVHELRQAHGASMTLADVPQDELDKLQRIGVDYLWLMGVWTTGGISRKVAQDAVEMQGDYFRALSNFTPDDVLGSPYAIQRYIVSEDLGGDEALARLRERLKELGIGLILDFVPNHTGIDHPWVCQHPEYYIQDHDELEGVSFKVDTLDKELYIVHGRDPFFPGWTDTAQLNYRSPDLRRAMVEKLKDIATRCDGVRCDMAMLVLDRVISQTWGDRPDETVMDPVHEDFWPMAIRSVRQQNPGFLFLAEVYWDLEWNLQQMGFDATYDKILYDRLVLGDGETVAGHLQADLDYQRHSLRFIENHDEQRAARVFSIPQLQCASVVAYTVPGPTLIHEGQLEGRLFRVPVQLRRRQPEQANQVLVEFYDKLLRLLKQPVIQQGVWGRIRKEEAWDHDDTYKRIVAHRWDTEDDVLLVVVNYQNQDGQAFLPMKLPGSSKMVTLRDLMSGETYVRDREEVQNKGIYVKLPAWSFHLFTVE